jgi:hypothetical protein
MAEVEAPGGQDTHQQQLQQQPQPAQNAPHGKKRAAENGLENEQRLSKRFDLLNLGMHVSAPAAPVVANGVTVEGNGTRLYIPVPGSSDAAAQSSKPVPKPVAPVAETHKKKRAGKPRPPPSGDGMDVEDTPHRVYIHDLAAELSDIESDEENPIFLSDIEKHLSKIPKHILAGPELKATKDNQLVLYNVPSSLTIPEEQDRVRKAIVEARARIRENQASLPGESEACSTNGESASSMQQDGPDDMDLD